MRTKISNKINLKVYTGDAFIGIDVHRKSYSIAIVVNQVVVKKCKMPSEPESLLRFVKSFLPKARLYSVYEAGFSGYTLHRVLEQNGINNIIVNPASMQTASANRVKTDKLDSVKLAEHLSYGFLKGIRVRSETEEEQRLLSRNRRMLVKDRVRMMARCRMRLIQFSLLPSSFDKILTLKSVKSIIYKQGTSKLIKESMSHIIKVWEQLEEELKIIRREYKNRESLDPIVQKYMSVPGIGIITAVTLADELLDCAQFKSERELFSFIGLTPSEHSSGERIRKGRITRQGNPILRFMLIESAWTAIRYDPILKKFYGRLAAKRGSNKAIVAVARKLIGRARAIIKHGVEYELNYNKVSNCNLVN